MGKNAGQIATWGDIYEMVGEKQNASHGTVAYFFKAHRTEDRTKCPTKSEILATGRVGVYTNINTYADNQCVRYSDLYLKSATFTFRLQECISIINASTDWFKISHNGTGSWNIITQNTSLSNTSGTKDYTVTFNYTTDMLKATKVQFQCGDLTSKRSWGLLLNPAGTWFNLGNTTAEGVSDYGYSGTLSYDAGAIYSMLGAGMSIDC